MAIYIPKFKGYMVDVADLIFTRCDGKPFYYDEASQTNFADTMNSITINGGSSAQPRAMIDTNRETTFTFTSAQFSADMFEMANATQAVDKDYGVFESDSFTVVAGTSDAPVIKLPFEVQPSSVIIVGLEYATTAAAGKYTVVYTPASGTEGSEGYVAPVTTITFDAGDVTIGDDVRVYYKRRVVNAHVIDVKTNTTTAKGSLHARWGVYSDGQDCTAASLKGYWHLTIPRVRVTQMPGFDNSYKSAATNSVQFTTMDARRTDKNAFTWAFEELNSAGGINTNYNGTMDWGL